jgi:hypothetical protein
MYDINGTVREVPSKVHSHRLICLQIPGGKGTSQCRALDCISSDVLSSESLLMLKDSPAYHHGGMGSIPNLSICDLWKQSSAVTGLFQSTSCPPVCIMLPISFIYLRRFGGAVGWGIVLQAVRSWVQFLMVPLELFIDIILPATLWPWGRLSL